MALLFVGGVMNVLWITLLALLVLLEKLTPYRRWVGRVAGIGLYRHRRSDVVIVATVMSGIYKAKIRRQEWRFGEPLQRCGFTHSTVPVQLFNPCYRGSLAAKNPALIQPFKRPFST